MPNWCSNHLTITGPDADVKAFIEAALGTPEQQPKYKPYPDIPDLDDAKPETQVLCFHRLVPIPDRLLKKVYDGGGYDWEVKNWGVKWGASGCRITFEGEGQVEYEFQTPWSPPLKFLDKVAEKFPTLEFSLTADEPGMRIKGSAEWANGKQTWVTFN